MSKVAAFAEVRPTDTELFKKLVDAKGITLSQLETEATEAEKNLPTFDERVQALNPIPGVIDEDTVHEAARTEINKYVQVFIDPPVSLEGSVWNTKEKAVITVEVRSTCMPLRDIVLELRVDNNITLLPPPLPIPVTPNKRYLTKLEPGITQKFAFWALAGPQPFQATIQEFLTAEVVDDAGKIPATRVVKCNNVLRMEHDAHISTAVLRVLRLSDSWLTKPFAAR